MSWKKLGRFVPFGAVVLALPEGWAVPAFGAVRVAPAAFRVALAVLPRALVVFPDAEVLFLDPPALLRDAFAALLEALPELFDTLAELFETLTVVLPTLAVLPERFADSPLPPTCDTSPSWPTYTLPLAYATPPLSPTTAPAVFTLPVYGL
jgi:hypothetical protein